MFVFPAFTIACFQELTCLRREENHALLTNDTRIGGFTILHHDSLRD